MSSVSGLVTDGGLPPSNSWVLPEHKMVYISVTKVACTGLRWMFADLAGEDASRFHNAAGPHLTRLMTVHAMRSKWKHVGRLSDMPREEVEAISPDNGWFVFAVVRDPWSRLWSAWQSKFLVRHPYFVRDYQDEPWFPRVPKDADELLEDWRTFVEKHPWTDLPELSKDSHFWPQVRSVRPHGLAYSGIYDLADLGRLTSDVHGHLQGLGRDQELYLPRANETPLRMTEDVLAGGVAESIEDLYAADFDEFGDRWDRSRLRLHERWTQDAIHSVGFHVAVSERVGDLSETTMSLAHQLRSVRAELKSTKQELRSTRRRLRGATTATAAATGGTAPAASLPRRALRRGVRTLRSLRASMGGR